MLRCCLCLIALSVLLLPARPGVAQLPVEDWTDRPDAHAPAGVVADALVPAGSQQIRVRLQGMSHEQLMMERFEVDETDVLQDWEMAPRSFTRMVLALEYQAGLADWAGLSIRVPGVYTSADFRTGLDVLGTGSAMGLGDIEVRLLLSLLDHWPYRAHLVAGASAPTGTVRARDVLPNDPGTEQILPFPMQPGDGMTSILPGAVFAAENDHGTVGLQVDGRIPVAENWRGWTPAHQARATVWMGYRFTDWVSGSARVTFTSRGDIDTVDPGVDPFSSPMGHPFAQGGNELVVPLGLNVLFRDGPLEGHRLSAELIVPAHHDLNGPQLRSRIGGAVSWSVDF
jgi:hypothetical protein